MIIVSLSVAAVLVIASLTGRCLARAREEWSVEFHPPEVAFPKPHAAARGA
jgi:hypothetical protein